MCVSVCVVLLWRFPEGQDRVLNEALYAVEIERGGKGNSVVCRGVAKGITRLGGSELHCRWMQCLTKEIRNVVAGRAA